MGGHDPILWLEQGKRVVGRRRHGVYFHGKVVLFANEDSLERFYDHPHRYLILEQAGSRYEDFVENAHRDSHNAEADEEVDHGRGKGIAGWRVRWQRRRSRRR